MGGGQSKKPSNNDNSNNNAKGSNSAKSSSVSEQPSNNNTNTNNTKHTEEQGKKAGSSADRKDPGASTAAKDSSKKDTAAKSKDIMPKAKQEKNAQVARYELFKYGDSELLTYVDENGGRIYEDDQMQWRTFPEEWLELGQFVSAEQPVITTWVSDEGISYETYVDEGGKRFYCDFEAEAWLPFKPEWEGTGHYEVSKNSGTTEDKAETFGTFDRGGVTYTTYEVDEMVKVTYYFNEEKGDWEKLPDEWRFQKHEDTTPHATTALTRGNTMGASMGGTSSEEAAILKASIAAKDAEIAELKEKIESLIDKGNRNIEKAKKKIKSVEEKAEAEKIQYEARIAQLESELKSSGASVNEKTAKLEKEIQQLRFSSADAVKQSLADKDKEIKALSEKLAAAERQLNASKSQGNAALKVVLAKAKRTHSEAVELKKSFQLAKEEGKKQQQFVAVMFKDVEAGINERLSVFFAEVNSLRAKYRAEMLQRKLLFNKIQELKGNIRVFCRCRGLSKKEQGEGAAMVVDFPEKGEIVITDEKGAKKHFEFDCVFGPNASQGDVFEDTGPLITSVMDGYNVCIFAYGQTGAGKTYTMMGVPGNLGVNFRSLDELFKITKERSDEWNYTIVVSFLEIYNESIRDLLTTKGDETKLEIRQGPQGNFVPGLVEFPVKTVADVEKVIATGDKNRSTSATAMNEVSSRSHSVLQIRVEGESKVTKARSIGKLTLCDLAGSERVGRSEAQGQRLLEAAAINRSLSSLGNVMAGLAANQSHIPYRDSKLTYLLQDSLGGDSKTCFFVNISPSSTNVDESVQTLSFGKRLRNISLGPAGKNVVQGGGGGGDAPAGMPTAPPPGKGKGKK
eukprot:comp21497_c0_seq1/m.46860 comp21497_c0_seq1/g.46860  ORF comp21497_c0_seq1/g.46860 comp21497_c0_seq1/m.46860 type:complete len:851 (+) comp21497_c0_seq1:74-2626(+)